MLLLNDVEVNYDLGWLYVMWDKMIKYLNWNLKPGMELNIVDRIISSLNLPVRELLRWHLFFSFS